MEILARLFFEFWKAYFMADLMVKMAAARAKGEADDPAMAKALEYLRAAERGGLLGPPAGGDRG